MWICPTMSDNSLSTPAVGCLAIIVHHHASTYINVHHVNLCGICVKMVNTSRREWYLSHHYGDACIEEYPHKDTEILSRIYVIPNAFSSNFSRNLNNIVYASFIVAVHGKTHCLQKELIWIGIPEVLSDCLGIRG